MYSLIVKISALLSVMIVHLHLFVFTADFQKFHNKNFMRLLAEDAEVFCHLGG